MRIDPGEFRARPLRVHALLHDVPLEDVWAIRLPGGGAGRTIQDVRSVFITGAETAPPLVKWLFRLRFRIGALHPTCIVSRRRIAPGRWPLRGHRTGD